MKSCAAFMYDSLTLAELIADILFKCILIEILIVGGVSCVRSRTDMKGISEFIAELNFLY